MNLPIIGKMIKSVGDVVNTLSITSKEKEKIKSELAYTIMQHLDKITEAQRDVLLSESKGNWLQRSWRPIVMLAYSSIVIIGIFIEIPILANESPFWDILQLGLGGYVIGRSAEKITTTIGKKLIK